jgi:hypothetical protein
MPANAALFFRNLRRPESFGFMRFSYGKLSPRLNKGGAHCQRNGAGNLSQGINQILKNKTGQRFGPHRSDGLILRKRIKSKAPPLKRRQGRATQSSSTKPGPPAKAWPTRPDTQKIKRDNGLVRIDPMGGSWSRGSRQDPQVSKSEDCGAPLFKGIQRPGHPPMRGRCPFTE